MKRINLVEFSELVEHAVMLKRIEWNDACDKLNILWNTEDGNCLRDVQFNDFVDLDTIEDYGYSEFVCEIVKDFMTKHKKYSVTIASTK
jgi:hypothetical protein